MASLLDTLKTAVSGGEVKSRVKRSAQWFQDKLKGLKGEAQNRFSSTNPDKFYRETENKIAAGGLKRAANFGDLFCYHYDPKYKETLPYYDRFPLIMLIGADQDTFLGCNFHYLNPRFRAILLDKLTAKIGKGIPRWKTLSKIREIAPTVKRYRFDHIQKKVIQIEEDEKELAIFLPLERFKKSSKSKVWSDSKGRMG
jgi:hypothetical protein|tara:strand:- start:453 stop:1046 length:594 start_codon:yes stop_codon:yes gene_type:complete